MHVFLLTYFLILYRSSEFEFTKIRYNLFYQFRKVYKLFPSEFSYSFFYETNSFCKLQKSGTLRWMMGELLIISKMRFVLMSKYQLLLVLQKCGMRADFQLFIFLMNLCKNTIAKQQWYESFLHYVCNIWKYPLFSTIVLSVAYINGINNGQKIKRLYITISSLMII